MREGVLRKRKCDQTKVGNGKTLCISGKWQTLQFEWNVEWLKTETEALTLKWSGDNLRKV